MSIPPLLELVAPLIGTVCRDVSKGQGSFLTFRFAEEHEAISGDLPSSEPSTERSQWTVWIYCCHWLISHHSEELATSESSDVTIGEACRFLSSRALTSIQMKAERGSSTFHFDKGAKLETIPYGNEIEDQWMIYTPDGCVYTYRSDGTASYGDAKQVPEEVEWYPAG